MESSTLQPSQRVAALFLCLKFLFHDDCGTTKRKRRRARQLEAMDEETLLAAQYLFNDGYASESSASNSEEEDEWEDIVVAGDSKRCVNAKPRGSDSQVRRWISDPFWFNDPDFRRNLRVSHPTFLRICELVAPTFTDSINPCTGRVRETKEFKVACALYHFGHGCTWWMTANVCGIGLSTAKGYVKQFAAAVIAHGKPLYMPGQPSRDRLLRVKRKFEERRNLGDIAMTIDGTHVPWQPDTARFREDYHNYKGWHSVLCLMFVDSYYMFVDGEVGHPGRASDSSVADHSWMFYQLRHNREEWLGEGGLVIGDGGFGNDGFLMAPFSNATTNREHLFNHCFSSTRFYVEQAFGWWKNRFRFLIRASQVTHREQCMMIYASMILHNVCVVAGETGGKQDWVQLLGQTHVVDGRLRDIELDAFYALHEKVMCAECRTAPVQRLYCVHADRIAAEDEELARSNGCRRGQRLPTIRSCASATMVA